MAESFASMLRYFRMREGLSQRELAAKLQMSPSAICMYETGKRQPRFEDEELIADFFNVNLDTLRGKVIDESPTDYRIQRDKAAELYERFESLPPEKQTAFLNYLEFLQSNS